MRVIISDDICDDAKFAEWLVKEIQQELVLACDEKQLITISESIEEVFGIQLDIFDMFLKILNSIRVLRGNNITQIIIPNAMLRKDLGITTQSMAKLIDVGNIEIRGTHIFSIVFNRVRSNLDKYLTKYMFRNGGI